MKLYKAYYDSVTSSIEYTAIDTNTLSKEVIHEIKKHGHLTLISGIKRVAIIDIDNSITLFTHRNITSYILQDIRNKTINNIITNETL